MRSGKLFTAVASAALFSLALVGCSGDDNTPTGNQPGGITDPQYEVVQSEANRFVDSTLQLFTDALGLTGVSTETGIGDVLYGPGRVDSTQSGNYWNTVFSSDFSAAGTNIWIDSVLYRDANGQPQNFGSSVAGLTYIHHWLNNPTDTTAGFERFTARGELDVTGLNANTASVNGEFTLTLEAKLVFADSTLHRDFTFTATVTNVSIPRGSTNWQSGCPSSGTITVTVDYTYQKDAGTPQSSSWTFEITFSNGTATVDVTHNGESATYTHPFCTVN